MITCFQQIHTFKKPNKKRLNPRTRKQLELFYLCLLSFTSSLGEVWCPFSAVVNQVSALRDLGGNLFNFRMVHWEKKCLKTQTWQAQGQRMWIAYHHTLPFQALNAESYKNWTEGNNSISNTLSMFDITTSFHNPTTVVQND